MPRSPRSRNPERVFRESAEEATLRIAREIVNYIESSPRTPVRQLKYRRKDSLIAGTLKHGYEVISDGEGGALIINEDAPYWVFVEFGTKEHGSAQWHVRPAIEAVRARHR
jgi:hypothetical protein